MIILDGINFVNATNHEGGMAAMLTGGGSGGVTGGKSLDQYVAGSSTLAPVFLPSSWGYRQVHGEAVPRPVCLIRALVPI